MQNKVIKFTIFGASLLAGVGLFVYLVAKTGPMQIWASLSAFGAIPFAAFFLMSLTNFTLYSWRWQLLTNALLKDAHRVSLKNMYLHRMSGYAVSYLTPVAQVGGEPARIALLMTDEVPLKTAVSSVTLDIAFEIAALVLFIIAGVAFALIEGTLSSNGMWYAGGVLVLLFLVLGGFLARLTSGKKVFVHAFRALQLHRVRRFASAERWLDETEALMIDAFTGKKKLVIFLAFLSCVMITFRIVEMLFIAASFGVDLSFAQVFLISTIPGIALLLPVPAGLGVFEGSFAMIFAAVGAPLDAIAFALIIRLRDLGFVAIGTLHMVRKGGDYFAKRMQQAAEAMQHTPS